MTVTLQTKFDYIDLYPVTCSELSLGRSNLEVVRDLIKGGVKIIQYREKKLSKKELFKESLLLRELTSAHNVLLIINDHIDIAIAVNADGVHLGQEDLPCREARKILGYDKIIGISTHNEKEALCAQYDGATYINIGPIFATNTKENQILPLGLKKIQDIKKNINIPFTVMGGINESNIKEVLVAGASKIAVVSALVSKEDIVSAVRKMIAQIKIWK